MTPRLSARAGRTLYNVADALFPPAGDGDPGGGDVDLVPEVERQLSGPAAARRLRLSLTLLELRPLLTLRAGRSFSRLPRTRRRALLAAWRGSRWPPRRTALERIERLLAASFEAWRKAQGDATPDR